MVLIYLKHFYILLYKKYNESKNFRRRICLFLTFFCFFVCYLARGSNQRPLDYKSNAFPHWSQLVPMGTNRTKIYVHEYMDKRLFYYIISHDNNNYGLFYFIFQKQIWESTKYFFSVDWLSWQHYFKKKNVLIMVVLKYMEHVVTVVGEEENFC